MRVLLLGKDGQVGTALQRALPPLGDIVALSRAEADFDRPGRLAELVALHRPDIIVNAAAYTAVDKAESEPERARRINTEAVAELGVAAKALGAWVIHYSTDYVFDGTKPAPYLETDLTNPLGVYGDSKRDGELALAASGARHLIFRTGWVHAPGGVNFIAKILALAAERDTFSVIDDQIGAPTGARLIAETTAAAIVAMAAERPPATGLYHLTASGATSWHGFASFIVGEAEARGRRLRTRRDAIAAVASSAFQQAARRPQNSQLATDKLRKALGVELADWRVGVRETLDALLPEVAR